MLNLKKIYGVSLVMTLNLKMIPFKTQFGYSGIQEVKKKIKELQIIPEINIFKTKRKFLMKTNFSIKFLHFWKYQLYK